MCDVTELPCCDWTGEGAAAGDRAIHNRDMDWLGQSDVIVAEVTQPSLGVGYELGRAVDMKKRVLCLFRPSSGRCEVTSCIFPYPDDVTPSPSHSLPVSVALCPRPALSAMIRGADDGELFVVRDYSEEEVENILEEFFKTLKRT
ncbi:hypothetical protein PAMP_001997 [Pampus punctatissimus]